MSKSIKMKGLLKGLRQISQIFDEEEEAEMQIGFPTDVKHVAHIGWDGPASINSPSWMNEFQAPQGYSSAPLSVNGEMKEDTNSVKWVSEDQIRTRNGSGAPDSPSRAPRNSAKDSSELPKSSGRHSSTTGTESPTKAKPEKHKQRRSTKGTTKDTVDGTSKPSRHHKDPNQVSDSPSNLPDVPKKTRRKKSKESGGSTSKSSKCRAQGEEVECGSPSNRGHRHISALSAEENELIGITT